MEDIHKYNFTVKSNIHDYHVEFINDTTNSLKKVLKKGDFIIIDNKIKNIYINELSEILDDFNSICIDSNESQKSYQNVEPIIEKLIENGFRKNHRLIAIGGGITQDCTAFMASVLYRGVSWIFYPTSLLAQGDSCIGSKTSINFANYKNLIGGFYPPNKILINPNFLNSLEFKELKSGLGEMLHYFIVSSKEDFDDFKLNYKNALTDKSVLSILIARSLEIKKKYIEIDEFDKNERQVFNYGHSFGHAIESITEYKIPHGIAVCFGMDISNYISVKLGFINEETRNQIRELLEMIWEGYSIENINAKDFIMALSKDKKNVGKRLGLILSKGFGKIFKKFLDNDKKFEMMIINYFENELN